MGDSEKEREKAARYAHAAVKIDHTENAALKWAADLERDELLRTLRQTEENAQRDRDVTRDEVQQERQRVAQRLAQAEQSRNAELSATQKKNERDLEDFEKRHQADAADRDARARTELQQLAARIQGAASSETRTKEFEATLEERATHVIRGVTDAEQAASPRRL